MVAFERIINYHLPLANHNCGTTWGPCLSGSQTIHHHSLDRIATTFFLYYHTIHCNIAELEDKAFPVPCGTDKEENKAEHEAENVS